MKPFWSLLIRKKVKNVLYKINEILFITIIENKPVILSWVYNLFNSFLISNFHATLIRTKTYPRMWLTCAKPRLTSSRSLSASELDTWAGIVVRIRKRTPEFTTSYVAHPQVTRTLLNLGHCDRWSYNTGLESIGIEVQGEHLILE